MSQNTDLKELKPSRVFLTKNPPRAGFWGTTRAATRYNPVYVTLPINVYVGYTTHLTIPN